MKNFKGTDLDKIEKKEVFDIPPDFFESLPHKISKRISKPVADKPFGVYQFAFNFKLVTVLLLIASSISLIFFLHENKQLPNGKITSILKSNEENRKTETSMESLSFFKDTILKNTVATEVSKTNGINGSTDKQLLAGIKVNDLEKYLRDLEESESDDIDEF